MTKLQSRKLNRLKNYDYSEDGWYYVTICSNNRQNIFGEIGAKCKIYPSSWHDFTYAIFSTFNAKEPIIMKRRENNKSPTPLTGKLQIR